MSCSLVLLEVM